MTDDLPGRQKLDCRPVLATGFLQFTAETNSSRYSMRSVSVVALFGRLTKNVTRSDNGTALIDLLPWLIERFPCTIGFLIRNMRSDVRKLVFY